MLLHHLSWSKFQLMHTPFNRSRVCMQAIFNKHPLACEGNSSHVTMMPPTKTKTYCQSVQVRGREGKHAWLSLERSQSNHVPVELPVQLHAVSHLEKIVSTSACR